MGDSAFILYKSNVNAQIDHRDLSDVSWLSAQMMDFVPLMYFSYLYNFLFPAPATAKADLEGLIKEFSSLITAHLNSSWGYFSSSPSFASHFVKSSLKAPG